MSMRPLTQRSFEEAGDVFLRHQLPLPPPTRKEEKEDKFGRLGDVIYCRKMSLAEAKERFPPPPTRKETPKMYKFEELKPTGRQLTVFDLMQLTSVCTEAKLWLARTFTTLSTDDQLVWDRDWFTALQQENEDWITWLIDQGYLKQVEEKRYIRGMFEPGEERKRGYYLQVENGPSGLHFALCTETGDPAGERNHLFTLGTDGTINLCNMISRSFGLNLDEHACLRFGPGR